jgi:hypothetical protein
MAYTPDAPFPKTPGNPIMAKDWNDAVVEVQRLETAKVNRAGPDALAGPLTIAGALAVGSNVAAAARLHVVDTVNPAVTRIQTTAANGSARLELWSDPRGSATEWRPGYIESFDNPPGGTYTGGLRFFTNGTGAAARQGFSEQLRLVNGVAGFGVTDPAYRVDVGGQLRVRQGTTPQAGIFLHQATPNANRAFIGMLNDGAVGLQGLSGGGWGLQMDTTTGNVGIKTGSTATNALTVQGNAQVNGDVYNTGNMAVGHNAPGYRLDVNGRSRFRDGAGTAGFWLFNSGSAAPQDRAFIGLASENSVGFWGSVGSNWGLQMNTSTLDVSALGRVWSNNVHFEVVGSGWTWTNSTAYVLIANMSATFTLNAFRPVWFYFHLPGVQQATTIPSGANVGGDGSHSGAYFRLTLDGGEICYQRQEWHNNGWELRDITLTRLIGVGAGTHTVRAEWQIGSGSCPVTGCWYNEQRSLIVVEF